MGLLRCRACCTGGASATSLARPFAFSTEDLLAACGGEAPVNFTGARIRAEQRSIIAQACSAYRSVRPEACQSRPASWLRSAASFWTQAGGKCPEPHHGGGNDRLDLRVVHDAVKRLAHGLVLGGLANLLGGVTEFDRGSCREGEWRWLVKRSQEGCQTTARAAASRGGSSRRSEVLSRRARLHTTPH